jgi:hypothetical protein
MGGYTVVVRTPKAPGRSKRNPASGLLNQTEYARHRGISQSAVSQAISLGRIPTINGKIDPQIADRALAHNTDLSKPRNCVNGSSAGGALATLPPGVNWADARAARENMLALLAELDYRERSGDLVARDDVEKIGFATARRARDLLLSIPDRLAAVLAGLTDAQDCHRLIRAEIDRVCSELTATPARPKRRSKSGR